MKRSRIREDWEDARAKIDLQSYCRVCGTNQGIEGAHSIGKQHQNEKRIGPMGGEYMYVPPEAIIPLCGPATTSSTCHGKLHSHRLNLLPYLTLEEQANAVLAVGIESAYRKLTTGEESVTKMPGFWLYDEETT